MTTAELFEQMAVTDRMWQTILDRLALAHAECYDAARAVGLEGAQARAEIAREYIAEVMDAIRGAHPTTEKP